MALFHSNGHVLHLGSMNSPPPGVFYNSLSHTPGAQQYTTCMWTPDIQHPYIHYL
uniref:Uncharacterized protein n=1 Tax=Anguilla anguilla TaxID=7936 RepID=A0A0E9RCC6_ANGAN